MTLTAAQVNEAISNDESLADFYGNSWVALAYDDYPAEFTSLTIDGTEYPFEVVDTKTGSEGDYHTDTYIVVKVGDQFFRKTGYYASHDGMYLDGPTTEVEVAYKQVQIWEDR